MIIQEISYSDLETGKYSLKSGVSQIIQEIWYLLWALTLREIKILEINTI